MPMPDDHDDVLQQAHVLVEEQRFEEAVQLLTPWTTHHPTEVRGWEYLATAYFKQEHYDKAEDAARNVLRLRPGDAATWSNLGMLLRKLGRLGEAEHAQRRALRMDASYQRANVELSKLRQLRAQHEESTYPDGERQVQDEHDVVGTAADDSDVAMLPPVDTSPTPEPACYCEQCNRKMPQLVAYENDGLCGDCLRSQGAQQANITIEERLGLPTWMLVSVIAIIVVGLIAAGLTLGRKWNGREASFDPGRGAGAVPTGMRTTQGPPQAGPPARTESSGTAQPTIAPSSQAPPRGSTQPGSAPATQTPAGTQDVDTVPSPQPPASVPNTSQQPLTLQRDPMEDGLLQRIAWGDTELQKHKERAHKYEQDSDLYKAQAELEREYGRFGNYMQGMDNASQALGAANAELSASLQCLDYRDQACFDLARLYLGQQRTSLGVGLLQRVEASQGGTSQLGAAARSQLQQLGAW